MDSGSSNDDDEPKICTVFSSDVNKSSKTIFDTIAFTSPKKDDKSLKDSDSADLEVGSSVALFKPSVTQSDVIQDTVGPKKEVSTAPVDLGQGDDLEKAAITGKMEDPESIDPPQHPGGQTSNVVTPTVGDDSPLPTANLLFADAPEVPFPIGISAVEPPAERENISLVHHPVSLPPAILGNSVTDPVKPPFSPVDVIYDAWIPSEETRKILLQITTGAQVPSTATPTMPGIVYEEDMVDKVALNMSRIFGEAEASRRKILTVDSVTQDDSGLRELIKLGCYRSAVNLTKRLLTAYGQGAGKIGQFSKHTPHSLQVWYTRVALLVRIREFTVADAEVEAFQDFENADMYYEYYSEFRSLGWRGTLVPFHFRLLAAEIPQYMRKANDTFDKLTHILTTIQQIISNVSQGFCEDGNPIKIDEERKVKSLEVWQKREIRTLYSLLNAAYFCKDFNGAVLYLTQLIQKDEPHAMQLQSALGRLYLQFGDVTSAERYFLLAAELSKKDSESDRVDTLVDGGLLAIGQNNYAQALKFFQDALNIQPDNFMLTNNVAVCLVYLGRVKDALALMESTVKQNTPQLLQENVILNLSTIYELENSDGVKKNALLKLISEYKGDGINLASLKMPNLV